MVYYPPDPAPPPTLPQTTPLPTMVGQTLEMLRLANGNRERSGCRYHTSSTPVQTTSVPRRIERNKPTNISKLITKFDGTRDPIPHLEMFN